MRLIQSPQQAKKNLSLKKLFKLNSISNGNKYFYGFWDVRTNLGVAEEEIWINSSILPAAIGWHMQVPFRAKNVETSV